MPLYLNVLRLISQEADEDDRICLSYLEDHRKDE